jgi:2-polyprenyl-3-methyl-5-hydroxy-6-metoxy-1,4-benzoquinol methylase
MGPHIASAFAETSVVAAYQYRPPYPPATFDVLLGLMPDAPRRVLDAGCGTGFLARPLAERVDHVDAVDVSAAMIAEGQLLPGGDHPGLRWITARIEDAALDPPYSLITAGDSLHWMEWETVMPRFASLLAPNGWLAILTVEQQRVLWQDELMVLIHRYSTVRNFQPYDLPHELESRRLFTRAGEHVTAPVPFTQSLDDYIASFHGRASFSRERMAPEDLAAFDAGLRALVAPHAGATVTLQVTGHIVWGRLHGWEAGEAE